MRAKVYDKLERSMTKRSPPSNRARGASLFDRRSYSWEQDFKEVDEGHLDSGDGSDEDAALGTEAIVGREQLEDAASHKDHGMDSVDEDS